MLISLPSSEIRGGFSDRLLGTESSTMAREPAAGPIPDLDDDGHFIADLCGEPAHSRSAVMRSTHSRADTG